MAEEALPPVISERTALLISICFTLAYIAPFYLSPTLRATPLNSRDAPSVIQARVRAVILTCICCTAATVSVLIECGHLPVLDILRLTGIWPARPVDIARVLALVAVLFIGPLFESFIVDGDWRLITPASIGEGLWTSWTSYRNLVVAPISEEFVFRSLVISLYMLAEVPPQRIVFTTPLIFGLAHLHHLAEFLNAHTKPGRMLPPAQIIIKGVVRSLFQFTYTSLFGFFAAFVFLRTGSIWAAIAAHVFCNWMGFPRIWGRVGSVHTSLHRVTPDIAQGKRDEDGNGVVKVGSAAMINEELDPHEPAPTGRPSSLLSIVYYGLLVVGAYGFHSLLWTLTQSDNALGIFD